MKTGADHARAYRTRKAEKVARMESALREIAGMRITSTRNRPDEVVADMSAVAIAALD